MSRGDDQRGAPHGWVHCATTSCGAPVFTPRAHQLRREIFVDCVAYVETGAVWVRSKTAWLRDPGLRRHEEMHLAQIAWLGEEPFWLLYGLFSWLAGYEFNPFEVVARWAEEPP